MGILMKTREFDYLMNNAPVKIYWENILWHKIRYVLIRDIVIRYNAQRLLDIGCGKGITEYLLPERIFCFGYDVVEEVIKTARVLNESKRNRQFKVCNVEKTLPPNEKFDTVVITEVLEHLHNDEKMLKKITNLLIDEGILILTVPNSKTLINRLIRFFGQPQFKDESHMREYTINEVEALLHKCGFKTLETIGIYLQLPKENHIPRIFRFMLSFFVDNIATYLPFLANSILLIAKKC